MTRSQDRALTTLTFVGAASLALAAFAAPGFAHPHESDDAKVETHETRVVKIIRHGGKPGDGTQATVIASCDGPAKKFETEAESKSADGKVTKSRVILCSKGGLDNATLAERLKKARASLAEEKELGGEAKAKALAALDAEIARLSK